MYLLWGVPGYIPEFDRNAQATYSLWGVPGSLPEYDQNTQVWYPGNPDLLWEYPDTCPSIPKTLRFFFATAVVPGYPRV